MGDPTSSVIWEEASEKFEASFLPCSILFDASDRGVVGHTCNFFLEKTSFIAAGH